MYLKKGIVWFIHKISRNLLPPSYNNMINAIQMASTTKRLDICAAQFAHILHLCQYPSLSDKVCLEIGSGWVLSHAVVCHLLGAKRVIATDIAPNAFPNALRMAIHKSVISVIRDILSPCNDHEVIRAKLDNLLTIKKFDFDTLNELGIEYIAPIDFAKKRVNEPIDFVFSNAVLEHVSCEDISLVLANIVSDLKTGGIMIHSIHLEDHANIQHKPFNFLSLSKKEFSRNLETLRGNRMRRSGWLKLFDTFEGTNSKLIYEWSRKDKDLPASIDPSIDYLDEMDLRTSHICIYTTKAK